MLSSDREPRTVIRSDISLLWKQWRAEGVTLMNQIMKIEGVLTTSLRPLRVFMCIKYFYSILCVQVQLSACDCASYPQVHAWNECRMSSTFVTLAEVLEARGGPLMEEEVWSLLLGSAEALVDVSYKGNKLRSTSCLMFVQSSMRCKCNTHNYSRKWFNLFVQVWTVCLIS